MPARDPLLAPISDRIGLAQSMPSRPLPDVPPPGAPALPPLETQRGILNPLVPSSEQQPGQLLPRDLPQALRGMQETALGVGNMVLNTPTVFGILPGPSLNQAGQAIARIAYQPRREFGGLGRQLAASIKARKRKFR